MKILLSFLLAQTLTVTDLSPDPPVFQAHQGQTLVLPLDYATCGALRIEVLGQNLYCRPDGSLIVGIDIAAPEGIHDVVAKNYQEDVILARIEVSTVQWRNPPPRNKSQKPKPDSAAEGTAIMYALGIGPQKYPSYHIQKPFHDPLARMTPTDVFGWKRTWRYPDGTTSTDQHRGQDLSAAVGTPVRAMAGGVVVYEGHSAREGGMVILYHGDNVYSLYIHLSATQVREGGIVTASQRIGASGATGNVTGPHLHWAVKIGTAAVDPTEALRVLKEKLP